MLPRWLVNAVHDIRASSKQYLDAICIVGLRAMNYHATDVDVKFYRLLLLLLTYRDVQLLANLMRCARGYCDIVNFEDIIACFPSETGST